jgi:signal transduction histidine kinase
MSNPQQAGKPTTPGWSMEIGATEHRPLRQQAMFVYGTSIAIGLHLALIHLQFSAGLTPLWRSVFAFLFFLFASVVYATVTLALWRWVLPNLPGDSVLAKTAWQAGVCLLVFTVISLSTTEAFGILIDGKSLFRPSDVGDLTITIPAERLRWGRLIYTIIPIVPMALLCIIAYNLHWWRIQVLQGRERELRQLAAAAQLAALRAQIHPHFLFNSLNSIAQLISTEPEKAEACVERLAEIFRYMLRGSSGEFVPLADELRFAEAYLEIEKARFGDEINIQERVDEGVRNVLLPSLILQPLVENAVKHGISRKIGGGSIIIEAGRDNGDLRLSVRDTGLGMRSIENVFDKGVGLRNVRDRLTKLYGPAYTPLISTEDGAGTTVTLRVPLSAPHAASK